MAIAHFHRSNINLFIIIIVGSSSNYSPPPFGEGLGVRPSSLHVPPPDASRPSTLCSTLFKVDHHGDPPHASRSSVPHVPLRGTAAHGTMAGMPKRGSGCAITLIAHVMAAMAVRKVCFIMLVLLFTLHGKLWQLNTCGVYRLRNVRLCFHLFLCCLLRTVLMVFRVKGSHKMIKRKAKQRKMSLTHSFSFQNPYICRRKYET